MIKRAITWLLCAALLLGLPVSALAADGDGDKPETPNVYEFNCNGQSYALALAAWQEGTESFDLLAPFLSGDGYQSFDEGYIFPAEGLEPYTQYPVVFQMTGGSSAAVDAELTAKISSVSVASDAPGVVSARLLAKDGHGFPVETRTRGFGTAEVTVTVAFSDTGIEALAESIELVSTTTVEEVKTLRADVRDKFGARAAVSAEAFNAYIGELLVESEDFTGGIELSLYEGFTVDGDVKLTNLTSDLRLCGNGANINGSLEISGPEDADLDDDPYPAIVVLEGLNIVGSGNNKSGCGVYGSAAVVGIRNCSISGFEYGIHTDYDDNTPGDLSLESMAANTFEDNATALYITTSLMARLSYGNTFEDNGTAIELAASAPLATSFKSARFYNCTFKNNAHNVINNNDETFYIARCLYLNGGGHVVKPAPGKFQGNVEYAPYYFADAPELHDAGAAYAYHGQTVTGGNKDVKMLLSTATDNMNSAELAETAAADGAVEIALITEDGNVGYTWRISSAVNTLSSSNGGDADNSEEKLLDVSAGAPFNPLVSVSEAEGATVITVGEFGLGDGLSAALKVDGADGGVVLHRGEAKSVEGGAIPITGGGAYTLVSDSDVETTSVNAEYTAPTCTEGGYWTYTLPDNSTYTEPAEPASGHKFSGAYCAVCGAANPNYHPAVSVPGEDEDEPEISFTDVPGDAYYAGAVA